MKFPSSIVLIFGLTVLAVSCTNRNRLSGNKPEVIKINIDDTKRAQLKVSIKGVVPLETTPNSLIGYASKIKYFNHRFYVLDNNRFQKPTLFVFEENGKFFRKTIQGKGPGEVLEPFAVAINEKDSLIFLHDQGLGSIHIYNPDLNFIRTEKHDYIIITDFYCINRDSFLIYHHDRNTNFKGGKQYFLYTLYTEGFTKEKRLNILLDGDKDAGLFSPVSITKNEVLMVATYCNDIYQLINGKESIRYKLDFGKYNLTTQDLTTLSEEAIGDYLAQGKRVIVAGIYKTDAFLAFVTSFKEKPYTFFQSIKTKKVYCINDCIDSKLIPEGLIYGVTNDGTFFALVEPEQLIQFQQSSGLYKELTVKDVDNPYLILFKVTES